MNYLYRYSSKIGDIYLLSDGTYLIGISYDLNKYQNYKEERHSSFNETIRWLDIYFDGKIPNFIPKLKYSTTAFKEEVWDILLQIPYGKTRTYNDIAKEIAFKKGIKKMSAQAIGTACRCNDFPIIIPCHRVIGTNNNLLKYTGGSDKKLFLLNLEGADIQKYEKRKNNDR